MKPSPHGNDVNNLRIAVYNLAWLMHLTLCLSTASVISFGDYYIIYQTEPHVRAGKTNLTLAEKNNFFRTTLK